MRLRGRLIAGFVLAAAAHAQDADIEASLADVCAWRENVEEAYARLVAAGPGAFGSVLGKLLDTDLSDRVKLRLATLLAGYAASMDSTEPHVDALRKLLSRKDPAVLAVVCPVFAKAGPSILPALERLFASPDAGVRAAAARALGAHGTAAFPLIRKNLDAASAFRVEAALLALAATADAASTFEIPARGFLQDKRPLVRAAAVEAYGRIAPDRRKAAQEIISMLDDPDPRVVAAAAEVLGTHASERLPALVTALDDASPVRAARLAEILAGLPTETAAAYGAAVTAAPPPARNALLAAMRPEMIAPLPAEAREAITRWAGGADATDRLAALGVVGSGAWPDRSEALRLLREAAVAAEPDVRALAVGRLGDLNDAPDTLRTACGDPDPVVRMEAACALFRRGAPGPDPLPLCMALLDRVPTASTRIGDMGVRGAAAIPDLVRTAGLPGPGAAARSALARLLETGTPEIVLRRSTALAAAPEALRASVARALRWLAGAQEPDGHWDGVRWGAAPVCDTGVTGLALLAFLSAGETDATVAHGAVVRRGLDSLVASQSDDGVLGSRATIAFLVQHGIATTALAEAACFSRDGRVRRAARDALNFVSLSRNPTMAWRYEPRGGENDTFVTTWMVMALKAGEMAGLHTDPAACEGALRWIDRMTDPNFGCIGYNAAGGAPASPAGPGSVESTWLLRMPLPPIETFPPAKDSRQRREAYEQKLADLRAKGIRTTEDSPACTAAGLWIRVLAGSDLGKDIERQSVGLLADVPPTWDERAFFVDECYWHWSALVAAQRPRTAPPPFARGRARPDDLVRWRERMEQEILSHQAADGSWDPVGVWGRTGGRVFSTAMATLALLAPYAYPEGCFTKDYRRKLYPDAYKLLGR